MDYKKVYDNLIEKCNGRSKVKHQQGIELHHIIPRSFGGSDDDSNLVAFTHKEHLFAHKLLCKFTTGSGRYKMLQAYMFMSKKSRFDGVDLNTVRASLSKLAQREDDLLPYSEFHATMKRGFPRRLKYIGYVNFRGKTNSFFPDIFDLCVYGCIYGYRGLQSARSSAGGRLNKGTANKLILLEILDENYLFTANFIAFCNKMPDSKKITKFHKRLDDSWSCTLSEINTITKNPIVCCNRQSRGIYLLYKLTDKPSVLDNILYKPMSIPVLEAALKGGLQKVKGSK